MTEYTTARFIKHHGAQFPIILNKLTLLPERISWGWINSAYNDIANFAFGVATDNAYRLV